MSKMKYPCIVFDHDDTVVNSTATVHYPSFCEYMKLYYPHVNISLEEYFLRNFDPGVVELFRSIGMDDAAMKHEQAFWNDYVQSHVPDVYEGIREIQWAHKRAGGILCVVSHSLEDNILRDYRAHGLPEPDMVFGWSVPHEKRKPKPHSIYAIMETYGLKAEEILVLDDLKPGFVMAEAAGCAFAASGWANDIPEIEDFMRKNSGLYFKTVAEFGNYLKGVNGYE